jgi:tRNA acetyltransferase TAN1
MYDFNLLVSCGWGEFQSAKEEIFEVLREMGDERPKIRSTLAKGIIGVRTSLDPREVVRKVRGIFEEDPMFLQFSIKWIPIDVWTDSSLDSMREVVKELRERIQPGEKWRMTVEKRRYALHHKIEIIEDLAELIDEEVDLENPDKILRIEILGKNAGISVLTPREIFSRKL